MPPLDDAPTATPPAAAAAAGFRKFLVLWGSQTLSLFGTFVSQFAVNVWLVRDLYPLPAQKPALAWALTATTFAMTAPTIFGMPVAGAYADRHDKQRILIGANTGLALVSAALVALLIAHRLSLPLAVFLLVVYALLGAFHSAAFESGYPLIVPQSLLPRANAMMMTSFGLSQLLSPALAATLVGLPALLGGPSRLPGWLASGVPFAFLTDGLTFVVAGFVATTIRFPVVRAHAALTVRGLAEDVVAGFRWMLDRRPFLWLIANGSLVNLMFAPLMLLLPLLVRDRIAADRALHGMSFAAALAVANTCGGLGGVLGGVVVSVFGFGPWPKARIMVASLVVMGVGAACAGLSTTLYALAAGMFLTELLIAPLNSASSTLWQSLTPPSMLARALSTRRFLAQSAFPLGTFLAGWMAVVVEPWMVVTVAGAGLALLCGLELLLPGFAMLEDRMREAAARPD